MDELFEQIFVFIPVAILIFFRFFYENGRRRRQAAKPEGGRAEVSRPAEAGGRRPSADPVSAFIASIFGGAEERGGRGPVAGGVSAAELGEDAKAASAAEARDRQPLRQGVALPSRETSYGGRPFRYEDGAEPASNAIEAMVARPLDQRSPDSMRPEAQREPGREGLSRVRSLPELRRAIVMAELLGAPKALREE